MAQEVGYFEDNVIYTEGPFVICNPLGNGWRIEVEAKGVNSPILPHSSIYDLMQKRFKHWGKTNSRAEIVRICDALNELVRKDEINRDPTGQWAHGKYQLAYTWKAGE